MKLNSIASLILALILSTMAVAVFDTSIAAAYQLTFTKDGDVSATIYNSANSVVLSLTPEQVDYSVGMSVTGDTYHIVVTDDRSSLYSYMSGSGDYFDTKTAFFSVYADKTYNIYTTSSGRHGLEFEVLNNVGGELMVMKNGAEVASATPNYPVTVYYATGDTIGWYPIAFVGYHFVEVRDYPYTESNYDTYFNDTVVNASALPESMIVWFGVDSTPTPTPSPSPTSTPSGTSTPTPAPTTTPTIGNQVLMFEVVGSGQVYALKNGNIEALATPGHTVNVTYAINDTVGWANLAYVNNTFLNTCDVPYTECSTQISETHTVIGQLPIKMVSSFLHNGTTVNNQYVLFQAIGQGQIYVFNNGSMMGLATPGHDANVSFSMGATIGWQSYPYIGNTLVSTCDYPFTECVTTTVASYTVIGQLPQRMISTFTNHSGSTVTPAPTYPGNVGSGCTDTINCVDYQGGINGLGDAYGGIMGALSVEMKILISLFIVIGFAYSMGMTGFLVGIVVASFIVLSVWAVVLFAIAAIAYFIFKNGGGSNE